MSLVTVPGKIAVLRDHTLIVMANDQGHQVICISADVLPAKEESAKRLDDCLCVFEEIANLKLENGEIAYDGRVWITASDMIGPSCERH